MGAVHAHFPRSTRNLKGLTAADIAEAHRKDLEIQERYGVHFLTYWFDEARGTNFCLVDAPDVATAMRVHDEAHGDVAKDVIEVDLSAVEAFLGRVSDPAPPSPEARVTFDAALRAIMFTDIVNSTGMTARLGDARAVEMVRAHDSMVRRGLKDTRGRRSSIRATASWRPSMIPRLPCNALGRSSKPSMPSTLRAKRSCACASAWMSESLSPTATTYSERLCKLRLAYVRWLSRMRSWFRVPSATL